MHDHPIPDRHGINIYTSDPVFGRLLDLYLPTALRTHLEPHLVNLGALAGGVLDELALIADKNPPTLAHRTRTGIDHQSIHKHPAYVELERVAFSQYGLAALSHRGGVLDWPEPMPPAAKYALTYLFVQAEFGVCCPLSMTDSLTRTLRKFGSTDLIQRYLDNLTTQDFDALYQGAMFMTEQGAGSDVAATETRAEPIADASFQLHGDKWFCSNPDAALAMVLARIDGAPAGMKGVSLFLLPRTRPDGSANTYRILRLKDKLGTRSMASGEIRFDGAQAFLIGQAGRGFNIMADMINNSRLSNGMRAAGMMRRACAEALFVAHHRQAFGQCLVDMPLMQRQLCKLVIPAEQARTMMLQTAEALRRADAGDNEAAPLARILTPLIKFRACRDARRVTGDAMEIRGGCGYIEEWSDPRLVRDAHLGSIWEGTSNIVALDVMRAMRRDHSLVALKQHLQQQLSSIQSSEASAFQEAFNKTVNTAERWLAGGQDRHARQLASALYHLTTSIGMAWEATHIGSTQRMAQAHLALKHRLLIRDPLDLDDDEEDLIQSAIGLMP
jgi:acyl-CoA dehydrogenase